MGLLRGRVWIRCRPQPSVGLLLPLLAVVSGLLVDSLGLNTGEIRLSYWGLFLSPFAAAAMALGIAPR